MAKARLSYQIRRIQRHNTYVMVSENKYKDWANESLPMPKEQADNIVLWLGQNLGDKHYDSVPIDDSNNLAAIAGTTDKHAVDFLIERMDHEMKLIRQSETTSQVSKNRVKGLGLTLDGWEHYYRMLREHFESRRAFMAMPFNDKSVDRAYEECFRPAVQEAGFELKRIDDDPPAGLIDDRLRVEIRRSRFLIADLTRENRGAYWEAGFAEGLGRPVIYTCEQAHFDEHKTHFDTNHCHTICWSTDNIALAKEKLKASIRATLPTEAKLED